MKASELMLGDWVLETEFDRNRPARVEIIEPTRVWLEGGKTYTPIDGVKPIPLTAEILEKNGFEKTSRYLNGIGTYDYWQIDGFFALTSNGNGFKAMFVNLDYVHQLQHALRLCGIDKDIEI